MPIFTENNLAIETEPHIRRRNKLNGHTTAISNIVIYGYNQLSDAAKMTYIALESYDWPDENRQSKGKAWPSIGRLATDRGKSYDSICRHLKELAAVGLITIESGKQQGRSNTYWLEEPAESEVETYRQRCQRNINSNTMPKRSLFAQTLPNDRPSTNEILQNEQQQEALHNFESPKIELPQKCGKGWSKSAGVGTVFLPDEGIQTQLIKGKQEKDDSNRAIAPKDGDKLGTHIGTAKVTITPDTHAYYDQSVTNQTYTSDRLVTTNLSYSYKSQQKAHRATNKSKRVDITYNGDTHYQPIFTKESASQPKSNSEAAYSTQEQGQKVWHSSYISQIMQDFSVALHDTEHTRSNQSQANRLYQQAASHNLSEKKFVELLYEAKKRAQWAALANSSSGKGGPNRAAYFFTILRQLIIENSASTSIAQVQI